MGMLMGALSGAAKAVERTTEYALRSMMDEQKSMRIAEAASAIGKRDATEERARVAEFSKPEVSQANGLLSQSAGLNDADSVGADESVGKDVQNKMRPVTDDTAARRARDAGDIKTAAEIGKLDDKEAVNATRMKIAELTNDAKFAKMDKDYQLGVLKLERMLDKAESAGKSPTQVQQIEYLFKGGMDKDKAIALVYHSEAKVGEYATVAVREFQGGKEVTTTTKLKPGATPPPAPVVPPKPAGERKPIGSFQE